MNDRANENENPGHDRLFKNMDEQERIYAPQQRPGDVEIPEEVDTQGSAGAGTQRQRGETDFGVLPIRPDTGINQPVAVPIVNRDQDNDNEGAHDTTQGLG